MLFQMLQKYTGIKFDHETQQLFIADPTQFEQESPFSLYDVQITPCIKTIQYAGKVLSALARATNRVVSSTNRTHTRTHTHTHTARTTHTSCPIYCTSPSRRP